VVACINLAALVQGAAVASRRFRTGDGDEEEPAMPKYAFMGGYTAEAWKGLIDSPESRKEAIERAVKVVNGTVDTIYWTFGEDDFLVICDLPDDTAAAATGVGVASSGRLRNMRTIKLITADEFINLLGRAKTIAGAYTPPGMRQPVGVG
jgi:uncharacterized protein with GYD domain